MSNIIGLGWTDTRIDTLKQLAADGLTASQIAMELGGVSRNAVLGKMFRMGLRLKIKQGCKPPRPKFSPRPKQIRQYRGPWPDAKAPEIVPDIEAIDLAPDTSEFACTIADLGADMCRFPMGDTHDMATFRYCGSPSVGSWCPGHRRIVYKPMGHRA